MALSRLSWEGCCIEGERRALREHEAARAAEFRAYLAEHAPHLLPKRRPILRRAAMALLALLLATGGLLAGSGYLHAREAPNRWRALAECGVAKGADYERKCRRFSRTERSTWRAYDGPGAWAMIVVRLRLADINFNTASMEPILASIPVKWLGTRITNAKATVCST